MEEELERKLSSDNPKITRILLNLKKSINSPRRAFARLILGRKIWEESVFNHHCSSFKHAKTATEKLMTKRLGQTHEHYATFRILNYTLKLKNIVEIGVHVGDSTIPLLESVKETGGFVTSIDTLPCNLAKERITKLGYDKHWKFIQSDSLKVDWTEPIDHLFIDGLHEYDQVYQELEKFEPFLIKGGVITLHDTYFDRVRNAILDYIKNRKDLKYFEYYNCFGLGVIYKKPEIN